MGQRSSLNAERPYSAFMSAIEGGFPANLLLGVVQHLFFFFASAFLGKL